MPRQVRLDAPGTLHHVMIRGIEGANIFWDDEDREHFLSRVGTMGKATERRILAWALLETVGNVVQNIQNLPREFGGGHA